MTAGDGQGWSGEVRAVGWTLAVAAAAGGLVGLVVGGIGGRLFMLVLRTTSEGVDGVTSDDGFEIGRISFDSVNLLAFGAAAGVLFVGLYLLLRGALPAAVRVPAAGLLAAVVGGVAFINKDGADLRILEPTWFALTGLVVLPAVAGLAIALCVERGLAVAPWSLPRTRLLVLAPALVGFPALVLLAAGGAVAVAARRLLPLERLAPVARVVVPALLILVLVVGGMGLVDDIGAVT